ARSFYTPRRDLLTLANSRIAAYLARTKLGNGADPSELERETARFTSIYNGAPATNEGWYLAAVGGFLMWTLGAVFSLFRIFKSGAAPGFKGKFSRARIPLACFVLGYALWLTGMFLA
ncbi:MAG: hypothetical protein LBQ79_03515, partial [Deltaproteobacteria bacterium]|nr:hypothetical protein [Deltaproteobacteria bacterium]